MAYEKTTWKPKDKITSAALNKIEDSLVALDAANTDNEATFECMTNTCLLYTSPSPRDRG